MDTDAALQIILGKSYRPTGRKRPSLAHANPGNRLLNAGGKGATRRKRSGIAGRALLYAKFSLLPEASGLRKSLGPMREGIVYGIASMATHKGRVVVDGEGDTLSEAELERMAAAYMKDSRTAGVLHLRDASGNPIVGGHVFSSLVLTRAVQKALGIDLSGNVPWVVGIQLTHPAAKAAVSSGEFRSLSIGGSGTRTPIDKAGHDVSDEARDADGKFSAGGATPASPHNGKGAGQFEHKGRADLAAQGLKPKSRGDGYSQNDVALVAWKAAQNTGKTATAVLTGRGWAVLKPGDKVAFGQPHMTVSRAGVLHAYAAAEPIGKAGHDVSAEPRDDHGRFSSGGGNAPGIHNSHQSAVKATILQRAASALQTLHDHAVNIVRKVVSVTGVPKLTSMSPTTNGGVQATFEHAIPGRGTLNATVQIHPSHVQSSPALAAALRAGHSTLTTFNQRMAAPIGAMNGGMRVSGSWHGEPAAGVARVTRGETVSKGRTVDRAPSDDTGADDLEGDAMDKSTRRRGVSGTVYR